MKIVVSPADRDLVRPLREAFREAAGCQVVPYSMFERGHCNPYLLHVDGQLAGYVGVRTRYYPGHLQEFHVFPTYEDRLDELLEAAITESGATHLYIQTNLPPLNRIAFHFANTFTVENILFSDGATPGPSLPDATGLVAVQNPEPNHPDSRDFALERDGEILVKGGYLCHYNAPYADVHMEVMEAHRGQGLGSAFVAGVRRMAHLAGKIPAARTSPDNVASRRTLLRAGFQICGHVLLGEIARSNHSA